jgi:hypothetical protein
MAFLTDFSSPLLVQLARKDFEATKLTLDFLRKENSVNNLTVGTPTLLVLSYELNDFSFAYANVPSQCFVSHLLRYRGPFDEKIFMNRIESIYLTRNTYCRHKLKTQIIFKTFLEQRNPKPETRLILLPN